MTVPKWAAIPSRAALAGSMLIGLVGCGPKEPTTDADRLVRGRELVQQMSARLAAAPAINLTTSETRDAVRFSGKKEPLSLTVVYTVRRPSRFHAKMTGGRGLEAWYN